MRAAENKPFLDRLQADPRQFENKSLLREVILNKHPQVFLEVMRIAIELIAQGRLSVDRMKPMFSVDIPLPGIFHRLMGDYKHETLIETAVKVIAQRRENKPEEVKWQREMLASCFFNSARANRSVLENFLIYSSAELVTLFFTELNTARESGSFDQATYDGVFNAMIHSNFFNDAVKNNRIAVLNGLKSMGYNLSSRSSSIHNLAGSAAISTVNFLLEEGVNINAVDQHSRTTIWYVIDNIHNMSPIIGRDLIFFYRYEQFCSRYDLLDRIKSFGSEKRFMSDNINKVIFLLEKGAEIPEAEAKKLDSALTLFVGKCSQNKTKYFEISIVKLQYLRGIVKEKIGEAQQASYHFIDAATQGDKTSALKLAKYYLLNKKEEDALIWYQQAIHNSEEPKPTLLQLTGGIEKMIQLAHGISQRNAETSQDLRKDYAFLLRELKGVDYSQETISVDGLLQLAHFITIEHKDSPQQHKLALQLTCTAYDKARSEEKSRLVQTAQQDIQHVMSIVLDKLSPAEAKYHTKVNYKPSPSDWGIAHYYRLCLELAKLNLDLNREDSQQRAFYWVEMAAILGHKDISYFTENLQEKIKIELGNISSVMPSFDDDTSQDRQMRFTP